jgi:hypothetical protein
MRNSNPIPDSMQLSNFTPKLNFLPPDALIAIGEQSEFYPFAMSIRDAVKRGALNQVDMSKARVFGVKDINTASEMIITVMLSEPWVVSFSGKESLIIHCLEAGDDAPDDLMFIITHVVMVPTTGDVKMKYDITFSITSGSGAIAVQELIRADIIYSDVRTYLEPTCSAHKHQFNIDGCSTVSESFMNCTNRPLHFCRDKMYVALRGMSPESIDIAACVMLNLSQGS